MNLETTKLKIIKAIVESESKILINQILVADIRYLSIVYRMHRSTFCEIIIH